MQLTWFREGHLDALVPLVQAVAATGGAVGWLEVPEPQEVRDWATGVLSNGARLAVVADGDRLLAVGAWRRFTAPVLRGLGEISKVMTHPDARGRGAAGVVVQALVEDATRAGIEVLTLDCRGNNHAAQRLYAAHGFVVTGRRPDVIAVGSERFDQVLMHLDLRTSPGELTRHGSRREGPGVT